MSFRLALLAVAGIASGASANIVIDSFSDGFLDDSVRTNSTVMLPAAGAIGGKRVLAWEIVSNPQSTRLSISTAFDAPGLSVDMGAGNASVITLGYGGLDVDALNLDAASQTEIVFDFATIDLALDLTVTLITSDGLGGVAGSASTVVDLAAGVNQSISVSLASLAVSGGFDAADIDAIEIVFNDRDRLANRDFYLNNIVIIPAPGALALAGLSGLLFARRRVRN